MTSTLRKSLPLNAPTVHQLPSGLTIVAEQMPVEAVNLNVWVSVGSAAESDAINGMAHFLEHMVFKGTDRLQSGEFERLVEERGAVTNAATSQDYTHYYITTAPKDFAYLAPLQIDVVLNPKLPEAAFERERLVVLEEIRRADDNPRRRTFQRAIEVAFERLPYRRPVLGPASVIENLTSAQMRDFHTRWYQPQSLTAVAVGNLPVEELIEIVADSFTKVEAQPPVKAENLNSSVQELEPTQPIPQGKGWAIPNNDSTGVRDNSQPSAFSRPLAEEQPFSEVVRQEYSDPTLQQARLVMVWRVPGMTQLAHTYALDVLAAILGQGKTSRLFRNLRENRRLVTHIGVSNMTHQMQGIFYIAAQLPTENVQEVEAAIVQHIRTLQIEPVTPSEIARVRTQVANRFIFGNETPSDRANLYGYYQSMLKDLAPALNYPARIQALDAVDLQAAAQRYLSPDAYGVVVVKPAAS